jgi:acyl-CoA thioesterase FadM
MAYEFDWQVRAADSDFTGLIYTPAVLDYTLRAINELMGTLGYAAWEGGDGAELIYPTKRAEVEFVAPIEVGDAVTIALVPRLGTSSITFAAEGRRDGQPVFEAEMVMVFVDESTGESVPMPGDVRSGLERYAER